MSGWGTWLALRELELAQDLAEANAEENNATNVSFRKRGARGNNGIRGEIRQNSRKPARGNRVSIQGPNTVSPGSDKDQ